MIYIKRLFVFSFFIFLIGLFFFLLTNEKQQLSNNLIHRKTVKTWKVTKKADGDWAKGSLLYSSFITFNVKGEIEEIVRMEDGRIDTLKLKENEITYKAYSRQEIIKRQIGDKIFLYSNSEPIGHQELNKQGHITREVIYDKDIDSVFSNHKFDDNGNLTYVEERLEKRKWRNIWQKTSSEKNDISNSEIPHMIITIDWKYY